MLVIVIVALLVFGPARLPEMMRSAGKAFRTFQTESQRAMAELREAVDPGDVDGAIGGSIVFDTPDERARAAENAAVATQGKTRQVKKPAVKTAAGKSSASKSAATAKSKTTVKSKTAARPKTTAKPKTIVKPKSPAKPVVAAVASGAVYPLSEDT